MTDKPTKLASSIKFKENFFKNILPALQKELEIKNVSAAPKLKKVQLNVGLGSFIAGKKDYTNVIENIAAITGQKPVVTKARMAISNFKIKQNQPIGVTVTVRGKKMYDFISKFVHVTLPRIRDFRGIPSKGFDGHGNYTLGIKEATVFPEVSPENIDKIHGIQVTIVTSAGNDKNGHALLKAIGFPFQIQKEKTKKEKLLPIS
jgi:large subunit ribosomal protein L5